MNNLNSEELNKKYGFPNKIKLLSYYSYEPEYDFYKLKGIGLFFNLIQHYESEFRQGEWLKSLKKYQNVKYINHAYKILRITLHVFDIHYIINLRLFEIVDFKNKSWSKVRTENDPHK